MYMSEFVGFLFLGQPRTLSITPNVLEGHGSGAVDAMPVDPSNLDTLPCSLPREFSPWAQPEQASSSGGADNMTLSELDKRILELQPLANTERRA